MTTTAPDLAVDWPRALGWRLRRQGLDGPFPGVEAAVTGLAGVQAQVPSAAVAVLAARTAGTIAATGAAVGAALGEDRTLVRTWAQRGTLHLLPAAGWPTWVAALSTRVGRVDAAWQRYHGITADELEAITAAIPEVLAGRQLTRGQLTAALVDRLGSPHLEGALRSGWGAALKPAANLGLLCHGPPSPDGGVTFVRPDDWLGAMPAVSREEGVRAVIAAFLDAHGPATVDDFTRWFGVRPALGKRLWRDHAPPLATVDVEGATAEVTAAAADDLAAAEPVVGAWLLPGFDPWVLHPRSHRTVTVPPDQVAAVSRPGGWISPVLVVDGLVAATWEAADGRDATTVTVTPLRDDLAARVDAALPSLLDDLAARLGRDVVLA